MSLCQGAVGRPALHMYKAASPVYAAATAWLPWRGMLSLPNSWQAGRGIFSHPAFRRQRRGAFSSSADPLAALGADVPRSPAPDHRQQQQQHPQQNQLANKQAFQQQQQYQQHGTIEIVVGPMFAGKTTELLRRVARYEAAGLSVAVVKSNKDDRYCAANVVTHSGLKKPCFAAPSLAAFKEAAGAGYTDFQVIAVDEAQFFPDLKDFCAYAADHEHKRVLLAGLDGDFQRQRFGQVLDLLPMADSVTKLTANCKFCAQEDQGVAAVFSLRITADSRQEVVGGADVYAPVCRRHYVQFSQLRERPLDSSGEAGAVGEQ